MPRQRRVTGDPVYAQIARALRTDIEAGVLRDGETLPSTRALARQWEVSVPTVQAAIDQLVDEGLVVSKDRSGRVVHAPDQPPRLARPAAPHVVVVGGYAGSGKTELGRILARATGWPILDKDTLTRPVVEVALETLGEPPHTRESEPYLRLIRPAEYEALLAAMTENVECGVSVVMTAPFLREFGDRAWLDRLAATVAGMGAQLHLVWVRCDATSMHHYVRRRGAARDAAKLADWAGYIDSINLDLRPAADHTVIDNSQDGPPLQRQAAELLASITADVAHR